MAEKKPPAYKGTVEGMASLEHPAQGGIGETHSESEHHLIPIPVYIRVWLVLMVGLVLTVGVALFDFAQFGMPWMNIVLAMVIAFGKAAVVVLYFMHVKYSSRLTQAFAVAGLFWLLILFALTMSDYFSRDMIPQPGAWTIPGAGS